VAPGELHALGGGAEVDEVLGPQRVEDGVEGPGTRCLGVAAGIEAQVAAGIEAQVAAGRSGAGCRARCLARENGPTPPLPGSPGGPRLSRPYAELGVGWRREPMLTWRDREGGDGP
jgi:hypothetical protein